MNIIYLSHHTKAAVKMTDNRNCICQILHFSRPRNSTYLKKELTFGFETFNIINIAVAAICCLLNVMLKS